MATGIMGCVERRTEEKEEWRKDETAESVQGLERRAASGALRVLTALINDHLYFTVSDPAGARLTKVKRNSRAAPNRISRPASPEPV